MLSNSLMRYSFRCNIQILYPRILRCLFTQALLLGAVLPLWGCGATHVVPAPSTALAIIEQPADASTPLGQPATFTVKAVGTGTLSYQWSRNGTVLAGATGVSYTTPAVTVGDTGSKFVVTVQDGSAEVTSNPATLAVGPRSPAAGDLRFQQVDSASVASVTGWGTHNSFQYPSGWFYSNTLGTPLRIGAGQCVPGVMQDCEWLFTIWALPAGVPLSVAYWPNVLEKLDTDLNNKSTSNTVVTSLDIEAPEDVFGMSFIQDTSGGGFDYRLETASLSVVPELVAQDGTQSRVVTAISFNDATGQVNLLSYGWASDKTTIYETNVMTAITYDNIGSAATSLANAGYIITAFGGNDTNGFVLVGTRVKGDSIPRPILVSPVASISTQGYALVGWAMNVHYLSNPPPPLWLYEK